MSNMQEIVWMFPILFIFHDFEEIILIESWIKKNSDYIESRFPKLSKRILQHFKNITTSSFALGVFEEFIMICLITFTAYMTQWYKLWMGAFIAFTIHLVIHCGQAIAIRRYVPALVTSLVCMPICIITIIKLVTLSTASDLFIYTMIAFLIMIFNLLFIHRCMAKFNTLINK